MQCVVWGLSYSWLKRVFVGYSCWFHAWKLGGRCGRGLSFNAVVLSNGIEIAKERARSISPTFFFFCLFRLFLLHFFPLFFPFLHIKVSGFLSSHFTIVFFFLSLLSLLFGFAHYSLRVSVSTFHYCQL